MIRRNLVYAFMYNVVLIPVAAMGLLYPALAGLAMAVSSVSVTASSRFGSGTRENRRNLA